MANLKWEKIEKKLYPGQKIMNKPDLIICIFHFKKQDLLQLIKEKNIFGQFYRNVYIIEYQK